MMAGMMMVMVIQVIQWSINQCILLNAHFPIIVQFERRIHSHFLVHVHTLTQFVAQKQRFQKKKTQKKHEVEAGLNN